MVGCSTAKDTPSQKAAAVVNDDVIPMKDLQLSLNNFLNQYKSAGKSLDSTKVDSLRQKILDSMIGTELLYQESKKAGYEASDEEVSGEIQSIMKRYPDEETFRKTLSERGLTDEMIRRQISQNISIRKYIDEEVTKNIVIPREDKLKFYEDHKDQYKHKEQVAARHIILKASENDPPESLQTKRQRLEAIRERAVNGEDFSALAKQYSEGPSASKGGELGYFSRGQMVKPFEDAAFKLKPGEISPVIQTKFGLHIIQVYDTKPAGTATFDEVEASIDDALKRPKINQKIESLINDLRSKAKIDIRI
jgi:peptidyl-prolyl cis-trans isomerase C